MTWLEIINIRTARLMESAKIIEICRQSFQFCGIEKLITSTIYFSAKYPTDISIHFEWGSDPGPRSTVGSLLSSALGEFGLVSHTLWVKEKRIWNSSIGDQRIDRTEKTAIGKVPNELA